MGKRLIIPGVNYSVNAVENEPKATPVVFQLQNGYANVSSPTNVSCDRGTSVAIRVRTNQLFGPYIVKTNPGYVIRAIATYDTPISPIMAGGNATTGAANVRDVQGLTEYELSASNKYSIITFCKVDATAEISANEDIVDSIVRYE